jgi:aminopeptidase-like protein
MAGKRLSEVVRTWDPARGGDELHAMVAELYPLCRSITGDGLRQSLRLLQKQVPLTLREIPSGTQVFDWTVPREWNIRDAYIKSPNGEKVVDFQKCNLHVVSYSTPVWARMELTELKQHLISLPEAPDLVPYRTSYYKETWGFCLSHRMLESLTEGEYEVCIDSTLQPGHLTFGEFGIEGTTQDEVLISCHACHPSLANDNLSSMVIAAALAKLLSGADLRYSYRFLWIPGTIGAIIWLATNEATLGRVKHGLVLSCVGDPGPFTYKRSRRGDAEIDRVVEHVLKHSGRDFTALDFTPMGCEERQYCSPGLNLPVGCFMRTPNGKYPQYHTSADNLSLVTSNALAETLRSLLAVVEVLEHNHRFRNLNPKCEPQLGRRGLYRQIGNSRSSKLEEALLWVLNYSDGEHSLLDVAEQSNLEFRSLHEAAAALMDCGLLQRVALQSCDSIVQQPNPLLHR